MCAIGVVLEDGVYCFDEEERGSVQSGGMFNSGAFDQTESYAELYRVNLATRSICFLSGCRFIDEMPMDGAAQEVLFFITTV